MYHFEFEREKVIYVVPRKEPMYSIWKYTAGYHQCYAGV
jgi:hypothetical protein